MARHLRDRKLQRALMQYFKPENYFEVRTALRNAGRQDLIGDGCDCLIPSTPPREAIQQRRCDAQSRWKGDYVHTPPADKASSPKKRKRRRKESRHRPGSGYRPHRAELDP